MFVGVGGLVQEFTQFVGGCIVTTHVRDWTEPQTPSSMSHVSKCGGVQEKKIISKWKLRESPIVSIVYEFLHR